jgi:hypothetical protein
LEFRFEFLEDGLVMVFPELLRGVFSGNAGEDLLAACASFHLSASFSLCGAYTIGVKSGGGNSYLDAHLGRSSDHRHPHQ